MTSSSGGSGQGRQALIILLAVVASVVFVWLAILLVEARGEDAADLLRDVYELTGSRLSGLVSMAGIVLLTATAAICLFGAWVRWPDRGRDRRAGLLLWVGLLTALLAVDDYMAVHELADDVLEMATGVEAERALKNVLELTVLGLYGALLAIVLWGYRDVVAASEWSLLALAGILLMASLALDVAPHSWLADTLGFTVEGQGVVEDTLKLAGIALYATYLIRLSASSVRAIVR